MTFLTMQTRLNDRIAGYGNLTFPDARKKRYLNDGYTEFARLTHILWKQSVITIAADDALYSFPITTSQQLTTTGASGTGTVVTLTFAAQTTVPFAVGDSITIAGITPDGYNVSAVAVSACTVSSVSYANTTTGSQSVAGTVGKTSTQGVASVLEIWRATWDGKVLPARSTWWMDRYYGTGWRDTKGSTIQYVLTDSEDRSQIRIYPMIDDTADITGKTFYVEYSYLPSDMSSDSDTSALSETYSRAPIEYAASMCLEDAVQSKQNPLMGDRAWQNFWRLVGAAKKEVTLGKLHDYSAHVTPPVYRGARYGQR